jgi:ribonuclease HII
MKLCGIDEAGKGPLIGPLVMCAVMVQDDTPLRNIGVKDSKLLSPLQRAHMEKQIKEVSEHRLAVVEPAEIDKAILEDDSLNLNWLEAIHAAILINEMKPDKVVLDCPSPNIPAYTAYVQERIRGKVALLCAHKADRDHPVVAAASILAKEERERRVKKLKEKYGDFGSGYMADPKTKKFFEENWKKFPEIFRKSWAPYQKKIKNKDQRGLDDF